MSGGSYNYLFCADEADIGGRLYDLECMAERLEEIGVASHAAADTRKVLDAARSLGPLIQRVADVWYAVEWTDSGDWGTEKLLAALAEYEAKRAAEEANHMTTASYSGDPMAAIGEAIEIAERYGQVDGAHHKMWVIDQMVRALTGVDYEVWRRAYEADEFDNEWDEGIAP